MRNPTAGVGFKPEHFEEAIACAAEGLWFEIHAENYMIDGGPRLAMLEAIRGSHPVSVHGVGLSLASAVAPDPDHLARLKNLIDQVEPFVVSEHLAWSVWNDVYLPDLLPFPRTRPALDQIARNIDITQEKLGQRILVENPSLYMALPDHEIPECEFLAELARRTGCGLLVDVNNAYVSAWNLGFDAAAYLRALPANAIGEIHLAGHTAETSGSGSLLIDTHGAPVAETVWNLYTELIARIGRRPTLIERDAEIPAFAELLSERNRADDILASRTHLLPERRAVRA